MLQELTSRMSAHGLHWKDGSLEYISPDPHAPENIIVDAIFPPEGFGDPPRSGRMVAPKVSSSVQLGVCISETGCTKAAIDHRISKAIKLFWSEPAFRCTTLPRNERLRRFSECVVPCLLFGCDGWFVSKCVLQRLWQFEGGLLRRTARIPRRPGEEWIDYMRRATRSARQLYIQNGHNSVVELILTRIHRLASHIYEQPRPAATNSHTERAEPEQPRPVQARWVNAVFSSFAEDDWQVTSGVNRALGNTGEFLDEDGVLRKWNHRRGWKRRSTWEDPFILHYGTGWRKYAYQTDDWAKKEDDFVYSVLQQWGLNGDFLRKARDKRVQDSARASEEKQKRRRTCVDVPIVWTTNQVVHPSGLLGRQLNGGRLDQRHAPDQLAVLPGPGVHSADTSLELWNHFHLRTARRGGLWFRHKLREGNIAADRLATKAIHDRKDSISDFSTGFHVDPTRPTKLQCSFDGGKQGPLAGCGWHISCWDNVSGEFRSLRQGSVFLPGATSTEAELRAAATLVKELSLVVRLYTSRIVVHAAATG